MASKPIFVTGGAGFIGSNFIRRHLAQPSGGPVVNFDDLTYAGNLANLSPVADDPRYRFIKGDICDPEAVAFAMAGSESVVHFAAESHVDRSIYDPAPAAQTNIAGTLVLLQAARALGIRRFIHISTDEVYGEMPPGTFAGESASLHPSNPYSVSKAGADLLVRSFMRTFDFPAIIVRPTNNYGPFQFPEKFLPLMISSALDDQPLPIYGDGKQERSWLHVDDHCGALVAILDRGQIGHTYNVGAANGETNISMAHRVLRLTEKPASRIIHVQDRPGHDRRYALNCSKIERELGWKPTVDVEEGVRETIDWYRENAGWLRDVRSGEYSSYFDKYYNNRDKTLEALIHPLRKPDG